ncbi:MAG: SulP family inorganic anion transporter [Saccharospirillum sp.]
MARAYLPKIADINAGLLVALVGIPQCLAYAMLSGLPPIYGLVTAAVPGMIAAVVGRSAHVTVGPTNTTGLIILSSLAPWAAYPDQLLVAMATLTVLTGLSRLLIVVLKAEKIFNFVPESVMLGFATGAALIIALMQLDELLGVPFDGVRTAVDSGRRLLQLSPSAINLAALGLGVTAVAVVLIGRKWAPKWPLPLLVLIIAIALVWFAPFAFVEQWLTLGEVTDIPSGWPPLAGHLPDWAMIQALIIPGFAVAFIGSLELIVTLRNRHEQPWLRAEIGSQGVANVLGSFTGAFPASTSLTRSVLLEVGGAVTRWAPFIAAVVMLPIIFFGAELIRAIPQPVIAGLLVATAVTMVKPQQIRRLLAASRQARTLFVFTVISTLVLSFHEAILLGALAGIILFLVQTSKPQLLRYAVDEDGVLHVDQDHSEQGHYVIQVSGSLYFAAARQLPDRLDKLMPENATRVVVDLTHAHQGRVSAAQALQECVDMARRRRIDVQFCGASDAFRWLSRRLGMALPWCDVRLQTRLLSPAETQANAE